MNLYGKKIPLFLSYAGTLMQGLHYFGKVILKITRSVYFLISNHLEQLIDEPTHVRDNCSKSCLDLICKDQPFTFMESGVLSSLDPHSKHNIIHGTLNVSRPRLHPTSVKYETIKPLKLT